MRDYENTRPAGWYFNRIRVDATMSPTGHWGFSVWGHGQSSKQPVLHLMFKDIDAGYKEIDSTADAALFVAQLLGDAFGPAASD
jgi:hypothetical protein